MSSILRGLVYLFGVIGGISLLLGVVLRIAAGPGGSIVANITPVSYVEFAKVCFLFSIALGVAYLIEN